MQGAIIFVIFLVFWFIGCAIMEIVSPKNKDEMTLEEKKKLYYENQRQINGRIKK